MNSCISSGINVPTKGESLYIRPSYSMESSDATFTVNQVGIEVNRLFCGENLKESLSSD